MNRMIATLCAGLLILCQGCLNPFAPKLTDTLDTSDFIITDQKSPEDVLQNFKVAYTFRDSLLYSDLLDTGFVFVFFDPNEGTSGRFVSWGRETDLITTGSLFRHFHVIDLVWNTTIFGWQSGDKGEMSKSFSLTLVSNESDYTLTGKAVFSFQKCRDDRWRITRWKDESDV